jgi:hypothetical protein
MISSVRLFMIVPLLALAACEEDDDPPASAADTSTGDPGPSESSSSSTGEPASPFDCVEQNFMPSPLQGPGIDPETGAIVGAPQDTYLVHSTLAVVTPETAAALDAMTQEVVAQAMTSEGAIGFSFSLDMTCGYARTLGIWESEEAMLAFVVSGKHAQAMQQADELLGAGRFGHIEVAADDIDDAWSLALAHLETVEAY